MKTKVDFLKDRLIDLFNKKDPFVVSLNGEWGVGKTHFWNDFRSVHLENKTITYTSLFGKDSIQSIKMDIILQLSKRNKYIEKSKSFLSNIKSTLSSKFEIKEEDINLGLSGSILSSLLTIFTKKDFENVIVCLDDFERISKHIDSKDILGLISELKEQKNCKIVLILNQDKIKGETLSTFKDKIIDYDLHYLPTPSESFDLVKNSLLCFNNYPLKYFEKKSINNIRVMKRVINSLNDFLFIEELVKDLPLLEQEIVENIIELSTINSISNFKDYEDLKKYSLEKSSSKVSSHSKDFVENEEYENILKYIDTGVVSYFYISDTTNYMIEYIKTSIINKEPILKLIEDKRNIINREEVYTEIHKYYDMFNFNMNYKIEDFVIDLFELFEKNKNNIVEIVNINNFIFYINLLKELDSKNSQKYHDFSFELLKKHLDYYVQNNEKIWGFEKDKYLEIQKFDKQFKDYVEEELEKIKSKKLTDINEIISMIKKPIENRSWGNEPDLLSNIDKKQIKKFIMESQEFVEVSFDLIREFGKNSNIGFEPFIKKLLEVFEDLRNTQNNDIKIKMTKLLDFLK